jgi:transposase
MRKLSEVLRLRLEKKLSLRQVSQSCDLARSTVADYLGRARVAGLDWPLPEGMDEDRLGSLLFPVRPAGMPRFAMDMAYIHKELKRPHVTLQILWEEYRGQAPDGYGYSQYCKLYQDWLGKQAISLRQAHRAGDKLFIDFAGDTIGFYDQRTGEMSRGHLFVAVLGCSNYTYAEVTATERLADWIGAIVRALEFFGGVPNIVVPDNTRALVSSPCRYDPDINLTFHEVAECYGFAALPTRPGKPRDKAKVEAGVLVAERWILARLRDRRFFSLGEINEAVSNLLQRLNEHSFKKLPGCRKSLFETLEKPVLKALPERAYEMAWWKKAVANIDYHVEVDGHYYSVPYTLVRQEVMVRYTNSGVEIFHKSRRVAAHMRSYQKGHHTTIPEHRPPAHAKYLDWTPERIISWAGTVGPNCGEAAKRLMSERKIPEHAFRPCVGLIRLGKRYGNERVDRACSRALKMNIVGYRHIESMLKTGRDQTPVPDEIPVRPVVVHDNLRGAAYYQ